VWDGNQLTWGARIVWGNTLLGETLGNTTTWGDDVNLHRLSAKRIVWGNLQSLGIAPESMSWGNLERANGDLIAR
jgi:hypothetical protein